jgi:predicted aspartyl protease
MFSKLPPMRTRIISLAVAAGLGFSASVFATHQVSTITAALVEFGFTPVPLKRAQNHVYAQCRSKGQIFNLVVDTGAQSTVVSAAKVGSIAGAVKKMEGHVYGMMGEMAGTRRSAEISDFEVGSYKAGSQQIELWDFSRHRPPAVGMSADGLLGIDFLHRHQAVIDCFQMNLFLKSPGAPSSSAALASGLRAGGCTEVPLQIVPSGLAVSTRINGAQGYLIVDTGAPWTILRDRAIADLKLRRLSAGWAKGLSDASGMSDTRLYMVNFTTMEIGGFSVPPQGIGVAELSGLTTGGPGGVFFGYLGQDLLAYYVGIIDCKALKLYLRLDPKIEAERKRHGG